MALVVKDRVKVTTATTGTGTLTLGSAVAGFQAFSAVLSNADTTYYAIFESSTGAFEVGLGTYASPANTLARTTVLESSNAGSAINLTAGDADVFVTQPAEKAVYLDADGYIFVSDGRNLTNLNATNLTTGTVNDARLPATISSDITGNAATATAWATGRTLALTGDVTGTSAAFDGSGNITLSTTIAANSVALGTDTTGNYVAVGATSGNGISGGVSSEGGTFTVTSNATDANTASTIVFRDASGNFSAGTITANLTGTASNANTLDSLDSSQFLRSDTADSTASTISFTGDIEVGDQILHNGDTDTYLQFHAADQFRVVTGDVERFEINNSDVTVQSALKEKYVALSGTTPSIDVDAGGGFSLTTSGNTTFTFTAFTSALSCGFVLQLTAGGTHTITWPASVEWAGGTAPDAPASGETDILVFWSRDGGTNWYGVLTIDAAA